LIAALVLDRGYAYAEGGDEFIVILPNTNAVLAEALTAELLERIRSTTFEVDREPVRVTASAGIAVSTIAEDAQRCREAASAAKRDAKGKGKDRYVLAITKDHGGAVPLRQWHGQLGAPSLERRSGRRLDEQARSSVVYVEVIDGGGIEYILQQGQQRATYRTRNLQRDVAKSLRGLDNVGDAARVIMHRRGEHISALR
jgi:hypothetical protein